MTQRTPQQADHNSQHRPPTTSRKRLYIDGSIVAVVCLLVVFLILRHWNGAQLEADNKAEYTAAYLKSEQRKADCIELWRRKFDAVSGIRNVEYLEEIGRARVSCIECEDGKIANLQRSLGMSDAEVDRIQVNLAAEVKQCFYDAQK